MYFCRGHYCGYGCTIAVCVLDGEFTVKRFTRRRDEVVLVAENPAFPEIHVGQDFKVWGDMDPAQGR